MLRSTGRLFQAANPELLSFSRQGHAVLTVRRDVTRTQGGLHGLPRSCGGMAFYRGWALSLFRGLSTERPGHAAPERFGDAADALGDSDGAHPSVKDGVIPVDEAAGSGSSGRWSAHAGGVKESALPEMDKDSARAEALVKLREAVSQCLRKELQATKEDARSIVGQGIVTYERLYGTLEFLRRRGWTDPQVLDVLRRCPEFLRCNPETLHVRVKKLVQALGENRSTVTDLLFREPMLAHTDGVHAKMRYLIDVVKLSRSEVIQYPDLLLLDEELQLKPRYDFVTMMEDRHQLWGASKLEYFRCSEDEFRKLLLARFGNSNRWVYSTKPDKEYESYYGLRMKETRAHVAKGSMSFNERARLSTLMEKYFDSEKDTLEKRLHCAEVSEFLRDSLEASDSDIWAIMNRGYRSHLFADTTLANIEKVVKNFWRYQCSYNWVLRVLKREPRLMEVPADDMARRMSILINRLRLSRPELRDLLYRYPAVVVTGGVENRKAEFLMRNVGISTRTLLDEPRLLTLSLVTRLQPRYKCVKVMEQRRGRPFGVEPREYLAMSERAFLDQLEASYGKKATPTYLKILSSGARPETPASRNSETRPRREKRGGATRRDRGAEGRVGRRWV